MKINRNLRKRIFALLTTIFLVGQSVLPSTPVFAEVAKSVIETVQSEKDNKEIVQSSEESVPQVDKESIPIESEKVTTEKVLDETAKANDSPKLSDSAFVSPEVKLEPNEQELLEKFMQENNLGLSTNGKFMKLDGNNYIDFDITKLIPNTATARMARAGLTVEVPSWTNIPNIDAHFSNGLREYGWYGKRVSGGVAYCTEPGVALNLGANGGYTQSVATDAQAIKASLVNYYGYEKGGKTLINEMKVQFLIWEIINGIKPTSMSGSALSMSEYNSWRSDILSKVDMFYKTVSFAGKAVTIKVGESVTLTDTTGALAFYNLGANNTGLTVTKSGNKVTLKADNNSTNGRVQFKYDIDAYYQGPSLYLNHPYTQNVMTMGLNDPKSFTIPIEVEKKGSLDLLKVDEETNQPLAGAQFKISHGNTVVEKTGDSNGKVSLPDLADAGTEVTVEEIKAPNGYVLNSTPIKVVLEAGKTKTLTFTNKEISGSVKLIKYADEDWHTGEKNRFLAGAEFSLIRDVAGKETVLDKQTSNAKGEINFADVRYGKALLRETKTPEGYLPVADILIDITEDGQLIELTATDKVIQERAQIIKVGEDSDKSILTKDGIFKIKNMQTGKFVTETDSLTGKVTDTYTTDKDGIINTLPLSNGNYELSEIKAPNGYLVLTKPIPFKVDGTHNGLIKIKVGNKLAKGTVELSKTGQKAISVETVESEYGMIYTPVFDYEALEGATFDIFAKKDVVTGDGVVRHKAGDLVNTYTTDELGKFKSDELFVGSYQSIEKSAPNGFIVDPTPIDFEISYEGQTVALTSTAIEAKNDWNVFDIKVNKVDESLIGWEENEVQIETIPSTGKVFGLFKTEEYTYNNEILIPADSLVAVSTTENGVATFKGQFPDGEYYAKELNAGKDHLLDHTKYPVSLVPADNRDVVEANIFENGSFVGNANMNRMARNPIINRLFKTDVPFEKSNETAKLVEKEGYTYEYNQQGEGAEFELKNNDGEVIQALTLDETGIGKWNGLVVGTYFMNETKTSNDSLVLDKNVYRIVVTKEKVQIFNNETNELMGEKENTETELADKGETGTTDEEKEASETTVTDDSQAVTPENGSESLSETPENEAEVEADVIPLFTMKNRQKRGKAELDKTDVSTGKELPDTGIKIKDKDGKTVVEGRTDKNGKFTFDELPKGKYTFQEFDAPKGYLIDETPIPFEIKEDGEIIKCQMTNVKKVDKLAQTKATQQNLLVAVSLMSVGLFMFALAFLPKLRKENEGN